MHFYKGEREAARRTNMADRVKPGGDFIVKLFGKDGLDDLVCENLGKRFHGFLRHAGGGCDLGERDSRYVHLS